VNEPRKFPAPLPPSDPPEKRLRITLELAPELLWIVIVIVGCLIVWLARTAE
jgi:hypothetical protein